MKTRRRLLLFLLGSALLACIILSALSLDRQFRQDRLDRALIKAVKDLDAPAVERLLAEGASANARDTGEPPLTLLEVIEQAIARLQDKAVSPSVENPDSALALLLKDDRIFTQGPRADAIIVALLQHGAKMILCGINQQELLLYTISLDLHRTLDLLISRGVDVNARDTQGSTPLMGADAYNTNALLAHGADVNATDPVGATALHYANDVEVARILIYHGANVHAEDMDGISPLCYHRFARPPRTLVIQLLKQHGARLNKKDRQALAELSSRGR